MMTLIPRPDLDSLASKQGNARMAQYANSKTEIGQQIGFYRSHTRNFQLLGGSLLAGRSWGMRGGR